MMIIIIHAAWMGTNAVKTTLQPLSSFFNANRAQTEKHFNTFNTLFSQSAGKLILEIHV